MGSRTLAFFAAITPENGYELWKSDGTAAGTVLVKDILASSRLRGPRSARRCSEHVEDHNVANAGAHAPCAGELGLLNRLHSADRNSTQ